MNDASTMADKAARINNERWWRNELHALNPHLAAKLVDAGFSTADDLRKAGPMKILAAKGIGKVGLEEVREWLCSLDEK